jgi:hypothetical protein
MTQGPMILTRREFGKVLVAAPLAAGAAQQQRPLLRDRADAHAAEPRAVSGQLRLRPRNRGRGE